MSRGGSRPFKRQKERQHPSLFFFIILAIGVIFLMWLFSTTVHQKPQKLGSVQWVSRTVAGT